MDDRKIKIAFLSVFHPFRGGIAQFNTELFKALESKTEIQAFNFTTQYPALLFPGKTQYVDEKDLPPDFETPRLLSSVNPVSFIKTIKAIRNFNPDVLISSYWMPFFGPSLGFVCNRFKKSALNISIVHNAIPHEKRFGDVKLVRYFINQCSMLFTLSNKVADEINSINPSAKVKTLFHPVYNTFGEKPKKEDALNLLNIQDGKYILFFGLII